MGQLTAHPETDRRNSNNLNGFIPSGTVGGSNPRARCLQTNGHTRHLTPRLTAMRSPLASYPKTIGRRAILIAACFMALNGASSDVAANDLAGHRQLGLDIQTTWLPNRLRLVTIRGPWESDLVSIRVIVRGGLRTLPTEERYAAHFLEHLVFTHGPGIDNLLVETQRRGEWLWATVDGNQELHEFDVTRDQAPRILDCVLGEWARAEFDEADVERERSRIRHERASGAQGHTFAPSFTALGIDPLGSWGYSHEAEEAYVDTVTSATLRSVFRKRYRPANITLLVVGNTHVLEALRDRLIAFGGLPGESDRTEQHEPAPFILKGRLATGSLSAAGATGLLFPTGTTPSFIRAHVLDALASRADDALSSEDCTEAPIEVEACVNGDQELWLLKPSAGHESFSDTIKTQLGYLASTESRDWWDRRIQDLIKGRQLALDRQDYIADLLTRYLARTHQDEAAPSWNDLTSTRSAELFISASRAIRSSADTFQLHLDKKRIEFQTYDDPSGDLAGILLEVDSQGPWWLVSIFSWLITFVALGRLAFGRIRMHRRAPLRGDARAVACFLIVVGTILMTAAPARTTTPEATIIILDNSLRIVLQPVEGHEDRSAVRLVVKRPALRPASADASAFALMATAMFDGTDISPSVVEFRTSYVVYCFDEPARDLPRVLTNLVQQLDRGVSETQYDDTLCRGEWYSNRASPTAFALWREESVGRAPDVNSDPSLEEVQRAFATHMVANRMSLVIVGTRVLLEEARDSFGSLGSVREGDPIPTQRTAFASLNGRRKWRTPSQPGTMGLVFRDAAVRASVPFYAGALHDRARELAFQTGIFYDVSIAAIETSNELVILLTPHVDSNLTSATATWDTFQEIATALARPEALAWWQTYVDGFRRADALFGDGTALPDLIADGVVDRLAFYTSQSDTIVRPVYLPTGEEALHEYERLLNDGTLLFFESRSEPESAPARQMTAAVALFLLRDLFGPDARSRAIAAMCQCGLILMIVRGIERRRATADRGFPER